MAEVKVSLSGNGLVELKTLLGMQAGKLSDEDASAVLRSLGYNLSTVSLDEQVKYIAEGLLARLL